MVGQVGLHPDPDLPAVSTGGRRRQHAKGWPCTSTTPTPTAERARAAGAVITTEPATQDYGEGYWVDRSFEARDVYTMAQAK